MFGDSKLTDRVLTDAARLVRGLRGKGVSVRERWGGVREPVLEIVVKKDGKRLSVWPGFGWQFKAGDGRKGQLADRTAEGVLRLLAGG